MSDISNGIYKALFEAGKMFLPIIKDTSAFKYKYAALDQVLACIKDGLEKNGLFIMQSPTRKGDILELQTTIGHISGCEIIKCFEAKILKDDMQAIGSQITYMRRYAILSLFNLCPAGEDDDGLSSMPSEKVYSNIKTVENKFQEIEKPNLHNYVIPLGEFRGFRFHEVDQEKLEAYCVKLKQDNPQLSGTLKQFLDYSREWLRGNRKEKKPQEEQLSPATKPLPKFTI